jgi:aldose 1-epimerase
MDIDKKGYGKTPEGIEVDHFTLTNRNGLKTGIITYGAIVVSLSVPDREGHLEDVVLGLDSLKGYIGDTSYQGAIVGRVGNRIGGGQFTLDGITYELAQNDGGVNHLHGGNTGFNAVVWKGEIAETDEGPAIQLTYISRDGEEGYPGTLTLSVTYTLTHSNGLKLEYHATTDKPTILNPTHHSYFNLRGGGFGDILDHVLMINADQFTEVREGLITTGETLDVEGTPLDFRSPTPIGARINEPFEQLKLGLGYDHNYVLKNADGSLRSAVTVHEPRSGRFMEVLTTEPGMQFYSGNFLDGSFKGKGGVAYGYRSAFCLEAGHFPNSINIPHFPSVVLRPGETYTQTTEYRFSVQ